MAIYKVDGGFVISSQHVWLPGSYESERAAKYAFRFPDDVLQSLQDRKNREAGGCGGTITFEDLQQARARHHPAKPGEERGG